MLSLVSQAWRSWKSGKSAALLAVIALSVGIGSTTAIYTVVNTILLKPVQYQHGERFVALFAATFTQPKLIGSSTFPDLLEYQRRTRSFDVFGWFSLANFNLTSPGQPQHITGAEVTPSLAQNLGVHPVLGRWFRDDSADASTAVISNALWQRLGSDPGILGKPLNLSGRTYTVVGVMPAWFRLPHVGPAGPLQNDVWIPLDPLGRGRDPRAGAYFCYARLKPGVTLAEATADVKRVAAEIAKEQPATHPSYTARLDRLHDVFNDELRPTLLLLFGATGLLLLITCANVAGLLVARSIARAQQTAVRVALGAGQGQLALQYFLEGLFVSLAGAVAGIFLALALVRVIVSLVAQFVPRTDEIALDWTGLLFALCAAFIASGLSSLAPLWQAVRTQPNEVLSDGVRASAGKRSRGLSQWLVVGEIALAFTLLAVSAVLITQLRNLTRMWPGFDHSHLLTFQLTLADPIISGKGTRVQYQKRLIEALESIHGVTGAAFVNQLALAGCCYSTSIQTQAVPGDESASERVSFLPVSPGYFHTMRIPLRKGRVLTEQDTHEDPLRAVINEAAAARYWPNQDPIGASGRVGGPNGSRFQVVGVVGNVRNDKLNNPTVPEIYLSGILVPVNPLHFVVRSELPPATLTPEIRRAILNVDSTQPIHNVASMDEIIQTSLTMNRVGSYLMTFFALAALLMAALGVYGLISYSVRQRMVEIGTRMALGAVSRDVLSMIVGSGMRMAAFGIAAGGVSVAVAVWLLIREFGIRDLEALPFVGSITIVAALAAAASSFPAWRATLVSPMVAIRNEPGSAWQSAKQSIRRTIKGISDAVSADEAPTVSSGELLLEFADASRHAASFRQAMNTALETLRVRIGAESAMLLENGGSLPANGLLLNRLKSYPAPLPFSRDDLDTWMRWAKENRPQYLSEIETLIQTGARLAVPLRTKTGILGVLLLGAPVGHATYGAEERSVLRSCAEYFALMIENARLTDRVLEEEKLRRDLALAVEVQQRLLPQHTPQTKMAKLAAVSLAARSVGGDYYDFLEDGDDRIGIALADIAGKGVAAALIMSVVQASLRMIVLENLPLPQLAAKMNRFLHRCTASNSYATFFYAQLDESTRQLRYVNAGHNPPYLLRARDGGEIEELDTGGTVIGLFPEMKYNEASIELRTGDVLMAFTDGVTEAMNPDDEEFGEERLKILLRKLAPLNVDEMSAQVLHELKNWIQHATQHDDLTYLIMKVN